MKKIFFIVAVISIASSCNKEEVKTKVALVSNDNGILMRNDPEFTKSFEPIEGGDKADCSAKGSSCKIKYDPNHIYNAEMPVLDGYINSGNGNDYFRNGNWQTLFPEINNQPDLLNDILADNVHIYKMLDNTTNNVMYCLSTAQSQNAINTNNIVIGWNF